MKKQSMTFKEKEPVIAVTVLFLLGMLGGFLFLKLIDVVTGKDGFSVDHAYLLQISSAESSLDFYLYLVGRQLKAVGLFLLIGMTWINLPYLVWKLLKQGFMLSFLGISLITQYEWRGVLVLCAYYLPHALVGIPLWLYCFYLVWQLEQRQRGTVLSGRKENRAADTEEQEKKQDKKISPSPNTTMFSLHNLNMLHLTGKRIILITAGCFLQSLLEAWPGTWLLKKAVALLLR